METNNTSTQEKSTKPKMGCSLRLIISLFIIAIGVAGAIIMVKTKPRAGRQKPPPMASRVEVASVEKGDEPVVIRGMGTVIPSREIMLSSRVAGQVVETHPAFIPGGRIAEGEVVLVIDPRDYELTLERQRAQQVAAEADVAIEQGMQDVAEREWMILSGISTGSMEDAELALRKPQEAKARAAAQTATANLEQAELDLERTAVRAPFNCIIRDRYADLGAEVPIRGQVAGIAGTDEFWVQVSMPVDRLPWIRFPDAGRPGSPVDLSFAGGSWTGQVVRLLGELEPQGRMARLLISVPDPYGQSQGQTPLLLDAFVGVSIRGKVLEDVFRIPRSALRDAEFIWVADDGDALEIRSVVVPWKDVEYAYVSDGLTPGDRLIVSDLASPVASMPLNIADQENEQEQPEKVDRNNKKIEVEGARN